MRFGSSKRFRAGSVVGLSFLGVAALGGCKGGKIVTDAQAAAATAGTTTPGTTTPPGGTTTPPTTGPVSSGGSTVAKLYADTDRDGTITSADDQDKDKWDATRGAVFVYNDDDDDGDHKIDAADTILNGVDDLKTLTRIVVGQITGPAPSTVTLTYTPASAPIRLFREDQNKLSEFIPPAGTASAQLPVAAVQAGEINLYLEATGPRSASWDGFVTLTLQVNGPTPSKDVLKLRCAPTIFVDNTRPAEKLYVMKITKSTSAPNAPFISALTTGLGALNVPLVTVDENTYKADRWVQDGMQLGYQSYPGSNGQTWLYDYNQLERQSPLFNLIPNELLAKNQGMNYAGKGAAEACNYGGNLEVVPPHTANGKTFAFGRMMNGGGDAGAVNGKKYSRHMNSEEVAFLNAQGVQGPVVEVSSEWLLVGHVDEFHQAIPNKKATGTQRPWKLTWASPALGRQALKTLQSAGHGAAKVFAGRKSETTVDGILNDAPLMTFNDQCQARLDAVKQVVMKEFGLTAADFAEVPVMFEIVPQGGIDWALALNPGCANLVTVNDTLFVPDPEGPKDASGDVWRKQVTDAVTPLGLKVTFVDVFESYHELAGESHCGTNVIYKPYDQPWWKQ